MPRKLEQASNQPTHVAAKLVDVIDGCPWPTTVFITIRDGVRMIPHTFRANDPECDRLRKNRRYYEVGTFDRGVTESVLIENLAEAWSELK